MNVTHNTLHHALRNILKKNIEAHESYSNASLIAKGHEVQLFFKNKADNRALFNEKLMRELNITENNSNYHGDLANKVLEDQDIIDTDVCDEILLMQSLKTDKQTLKDFEVLLKNPALPLSIRLIIKEQIIFIRLDELKMEQLIQIL